MARPKSKGLSYFSVDVDMWEDDKFELLLAKHGFIAEAVIMRLLMRLYRVGYCYRWEERDQIIFASKLGLEHEVVRLIIVDAVAEGFFDAGLLARCGVLSSKGIQKRYKEMTKKRAGDEQISPEHDLLRVPDTITPVEGEETPVSGESGTQSKGKETKEKKSKVNSADAVKFLDLPEWILENPQIHKSLLDWITQRAASKHPVSQIALDRNIKSYENQPERLFAALENSIRNDYRGIFDPPTSRGQSAAPPKQTNAEKSIQAAQNIINRMEGYGN